MMNSQIQDERQSVESLVGRVADEFTECLNRGELPDIEEYARRYPEIAAILRQALPALQAVGSLVPGSIPSGEAVSESSPPSGILGDFRILREVGRGGMGIVYEAEQISLGRRVALKVLPFAAALDAKQLQRFKNEAHAAAHLQHQNIVPVYFVGCERGVHFYAMQYVEGQTLAQLIAELRRQSGHEDRGSRIEDRKEEQKADLAQRREAAKDPLASLRLGASLDEHAATKDYQPVDASSQSTIQALTTAADTPVTAPRSSILDSPSSFFHTVANLGIQAAEALEHAHQLGVIHRDIKPANLMIETLSLTAPGANSIRPAAPHSSLIPHPSSLRLWITDFGLAHCQGGCELTMSGDLLGTLRYMSPEQALAQRVLVDQRTDIYSLGVTLYELLTLEPAFAGTDRQEILRQIAFDDPKPPRRLNKAIPAELETIVLKAIEKSPTDRYATAQELADDLRRYLEDKPIRARRPTIVGRARKWARRHSSLVLVGSVALLVVLAASILSTVLIWRAYRSEAKQLGQAQESLQIARNVLAVIYDQLIEMQPAADPETKREQDALLKAALEFYQQFTQDSSTEPTIRVQVAAAYAQIASIHQKLGQYQEAIEASDQAIAVMEQVAAQRPADAYCQWCLAGAYGNLGEILYEKRDLAASIKYKKQSVDILRPLVEAYPGEPSYKFHLAMRYYGLGQCRYKQDQFEEASEYFGLAIDLYMDLNKQYPDDLLYQRELAITHEALAVVFMDRRNRVEAEKHYREAIQIETKLATKFPKPEMRLGRGLLTNSRFQADLANMHINFGDFLKAYHELGGAKEHFREALRWWRELCRKRPNSPRYLFLLALSHFKLGDVMEDTGPIQEVEANYREAWSLCEKMSQDFPGFNQHGEVLAESAFALAHVLVQTDRSKESKEICRKVLELAPDEADAHNELAWQLSICPDPELRDPDQAVQLAKKAIKARPEDNPFWNTLGAALYRAEKFTEALEALHRSIQLGNDTPTDRFFAAMAHWRLEEKEQARRLYEQGEQVMRKGAPYIYDKVLLRVRAEAAKLLGIKEEPLKEKPPTEKPKS